MNVILAVIVESAEETRRNDLREMMKIKEEQFIKKSRRLLKMCAELDADGSGGLTLEELMNGLTSHEEFRITLADMGIDQDDMKTVFHIMDEDRSGYVDYKEFVRHIHKMKTSDEQTMLNFI